MASLLAGIRPKSDFIARMTSLLYGPIRGFFLIKTVPIISLLLLPPSLSPSPPFIFLRSEVVKEQLKKEKWPKSDEKGENADVFPRILRICSPISIPGGVQEIRQIVSDSVKRV